MSGKEKQIAFGDLEIVRQFLNTWSIPNDTRVATEHLKSLKDVEAFIKRYFTKENVQVDPLETTIQFRNDLRHLLDQNDEYILNKWINQYPIGVRIKEEEDGLVLEHIAPKTICGQLLKIVVEAVDRDRWKRLKACPDCQYVFYDHTKNQGRVWCGMYAYGAKGRACGTIAKVKRHRAKHTKK
ncbi:CGNR zinc finger domain-containing protein [Pseudalkalibacillus sp. SCS-8]|uniref:CGNR zinc finger domain-containing protein n=1 Tax=Pseudalkalibacillus nanhaiensis TaxID=3115291 RepID=UPI0032DB6CAA